MVKPVNPGEPVETLPTETAYKRPGPAAPAADSGGSAMLASPENQADSTYVDRRTIQAHKILDIRIYAPHEADPVRYTRWLVFGLGLGKGIDDNWYDRHKPCVGGFYVKYENDRTIYLPSAEFERRYAPLAPSQIDGQASASEVAAEPPYPGIPTAVDPGEAISTDTASDGQVAGAAAGRVAGVAPHPAAPGNQ